MITHASSENVVRGMNLVYRLPSIEQRDRTSFIIILEKVYADDSDTSLEKKLRTLPGFQGFVYKVGIG